MVSMINNEIYETYTTCKGKFHRVDGPAFTCINLTKNKKIETWYHDDKIHRIDGPAEIKKKNDIVSETWYHDGKIHRIDGPAYVTKHQNNVIHEAWYHDGKIHRIDGPAYVTKHQNNVILEEWWYTNGINNRYNGPAMTQRSSDGTVINEFYYFDGIRFEKSMYMKTMKILKNFIHRLKDRYRKTLVSTLRDTDFFYEKFLCNEVAKYII